MSENTKEDCCRRNCDKCAKERNRWSGQMVGRFWPAEAVHHEHDPHLISSRLIKTWLRSSQHASSDVHLKSARVLMHELTLITSWLPRSSLRRDCFSSTLFYCSCTSRHLARRVACTQKMALPLRKCSLISTIRIFAVFVSLIGTAAIIAALAFLTVTSMALIFIVTGKLVLF